MLKKLLYLALPIAALAVIGIQTASADYYDCEGNVRPGTPGPGQCHYLTEPPSSTETETPAVVPNCENGSCGIYQLNPTLPNYTITFPDNDDEDQAEEIPSENEDNGAEIQNTRKYCVRDYCYFIFEICYSNGYCESKAERVDRDDYNDNYNDDYDHDNHRNWGNQLNNYVYNYFYNNYYYGYNDCGYDRRNCIYRGTHYGGYTNNYWHF